MSRSIFISYRRKDSGQITDHIFKELESRLGKGVVFRDVVSIQLGQDFRQQIQEAIDNSLIVLVIIGRDFADSRDSAGQKRIFQPNDYVHYEIVYALSQAKIVIPVLVDGAPMPAPEQFPKDIESLCFLNGCNLRSKSLQKDLDQLHLQLAGIINQQTSGLRSIHFEFFNNRTGRYTDPRDGIQYPIVQIGQFWWLGKNLMYQHPDSRSYRDISNYDRKYGRYYDFLTALDACPDGWRIPTYWDWVDLFYTFGGDPTKPLEKENAAALKKLVADDKNDFHFRFSGYADQDGCFMLEEQGLYWSQLEVDEKSAWMLYTQKDIWDASLLHGYKSQGLSVRCVLKDESILSQLPGH